MLGSSATKYAPTTHLGEDEKRFQGLLLQSSADLVVKIDANLVELENGGVVVVNLCIVALKRSLSCYKVTYRMAESERRREARTIKMATP